MTAARFADDIGKALYAAQQGVTDPAKPLKDFGGGVGDGDRRAVSQRMRIRESYRAF